MVRSYHVSIIIDLGGGNFVLSSHEIAAKNPQSAYVVALEQWETDNKSRDEYSVFLSVVREAANIIDEDGYVIGQRNAGELVHLSHVDEAYR